ncbi:MAG: hypothetical protein ACR2MO_08610 [Acidimicrobiales bacterium]
MGRSDTELLERQVDLITTMQLIEGRMTELAATFRGLTLNDVLLVETAVFDADGVVSRTFTVPYGAVAVANLGTAMITLTSSSVAGADPPTSGRGLITVTAGTAQVIDLSGRELTIHGIVGEKVTLSVFSRPQPPSFGPAGTAQAVTATATVVATRGALTDRSGTIAAGGAAQVLMAANATRLYLFVVNLSTGDLWINFGTNAVAAQPSIRLQAGDSFVMEAGFVSTQAVSIIGATTAQAFAAKEG